MPKTLTSDIYIDRSNKIHNFKYDYSLVPEGLIKSTVKVPIICPDHGVFKKNFNKHTSEKSGCPKCALISSYQKQVADFEDVKEKANKIHNFKYDYSEFNYVNSQTKSTIICPHHGGFQQTMGNHTNKLCSRGCLKCSNEIRGDRYRLSMKKLF